MTKKSARTLRNGMEIFNLETGEVAKVLCTLNTQGDVVFVEAMTLRGERRHVWANHKVQRV